MKYQTWQFAPISNIEESNFNHILERFVSMGVNGLTRENIQNSLDGHLPDSEDPVIVRINTGSLMVDDIPGIKEVIDRIRCLKGHNRYTRETIEHMKNKIKTDTVRYISFEDENTIGLTGAKYGQSNSSKDTWNIYAYNKGVHYEDDNKEREIVRGGSYGVGKIASNAASDIHVMYFANCEENGDQHLGGTAQLIEHNYNNQAYRSTGYFTKVQHISQNKTKYYPYENKFHDVFKKDTRGLKIVIPFLRDNYDNEDNIIKSICDSFFISILNNKLKVYVNDKVISKDTIVEIVKDPKYYIQDVEEIKKEFTPLYLDTYLKEEPREIVINNIEQNFNFKLYFKYDERISTGSVGVIRTIGMKIEDFKVRSNIRKPFNAILIGGLKEDEYLKSLENESHTKLTRDHINDPQLRRKATRFINNLHKEIAEIINEVMLAENPVDGKIDTEDILYVVEAQLKKDLQENLGTVKINRKQSVLKSSNRDQLKEKRNRRRNKEEAKEPINRRTRVPVKLQETDGKTSQMIGEGKQLYNIRPEVVQRVVANNVEVINIDFTESPELRGIDSCNVRFSVVDGMGKEYRDEFNLAKHYRKIYDMNTNNPCNYSNDVISNVRIEDGFVQLRMSLNKVANDALKFIYYVEV